MNQHDKDETKKSTFYGPFRKPRSTKRTFTRNYVVDVNENILIINPGTESQIVFQRPPLTYAEILKQIISKNSDRKLQLSDIYRLMAEQYPYFQHAPMDWRNSIRNCLSTNSIFKNVNTYDNNGFRQRYWVINEDVNVVSSTKHQKLFESPNSNNYYNNNNDNNNNNNININKNINNNNNPNVIIDNIPQINHDFNYCNLNMSTLSNEIVYNNYINTFCSEFFSNKCHLCVQIHRIGQKYGIECQCPFCYNNNNQHLILNNNKYFNNFVETESYIQQSPDKQINGANTITATDLSNDQIDQINQINQINQLSETNSFVNIKESQNFEQLINDDVQPTSLDSVYPEQNLHN